MFRSCGVFVVRVVLVSAFVDVRVRGCARVVPRCACGVFVVCLNCA